jgi:hypothetical protein
MFVGNRDGVGVCDGMLQLGVENDVRKTTATHVRR